MNRHKWILTAAAGSLLAACGSTEAPQDESADRAPVRVQTMAVSLSEWPTAQEAVGTVQARATATLQSKVMGYVLEVSVDAGDRVRRGQTLVRLDSRDLNAAYQQAVHAREEADSSISEADNAVQAAEAQLGLAGATFRRMKDLYDKKSISDQEFDEARARLNVAEANHKMAQSRREQLNAAIARASSSVDAAGVMQGYGVITAPFDGVVTAKMVETGNLAAPGAPLLTIEQAGGYRMEARFDESLLGSVRVGQPVTVELKTLGESIAATVSEVVAAVDAESRAFLVRVNLPNRAGLSSGLFGRVELESGRREVLAVPFDAVRERGQLQSVFVVEEGRARGRLVKIGARRAGQVEVLSGLAAGDQIVYPLPAELADGAPVEVRR